MFEKDDVEYLESIFDSRYVKKNECDKNVEKTEERLDQLNVSMAKIATKLNLIAGILGGIGAAILAAVTKIIFGG